jgi:hypothetical protein
MKNNLLLITHHFLPYTPSFGQTARCYFMTKHFSKKYNVYVIAAEGIEYYGYHGKILSENTEIEYVHDENFRYNQPLVIPEGPKLSKIYYVIKVFGVKKLYELLNNRIANNIKLDIYESVVSKFYREAISLIKRNNINTLIISVPPISVLRICSKLRKQFPDLKIILDYRDSWVVPTLLNDNSFKGIRSRYFEKRAVQVANGIVFISPSMKKAYDTHYSIFYKSVLLTNGFNSKLENNPTIASNNNKSNVVKIGYFGKMHIGNRDYFRDIRKLFDFFSESDDNFNSHFRIESYGYISGEYKKWEKVIPFKYCGSVETDKVQNLMLEYDLLLLYHSEKIRAEEVLTSKIFEYLLAKKPIIVLGPKNMLDARHLIESNNLGMFIDIDDTNDMKKKFNELYQLTINGRLDSIYNKEFDVFRYDRNKINNNYIKFIESF